jgi:hypothetical protein
MTPAMSTTGVNNVVTMPTTSDSGLQCLLGVNIGRDTTKLFAASLNGLAIKSGDRWVVPQLAKDGTGTNLLDVTCLTLQCDPQVYRVPVPTVAPGNLILTQDHPMPYVFFVESVAGTHVKGLALGRREEVETVAPVTILGSPIFVRLISLFDIVGGLEASAGESRTAFGGGNLASLLPLLLCCKSDGGSSDSGLFSALLFSQLLGGAGGVLGGAKGGAFDPSLLLLLLGGCGSKGDSSLELLLLSSLLKGTACQAATAAPAPAPAPHTP